MDKMMHLVQVCQTYDIILAYLFGSQKDNAFRILKGEEVWIQDPLTDIDLGVVFRKSILGTAKHHDLYAKLYGGMADLFAPNQLDLVFLEENHSVFQAEALKGICVYSLDESTRDRYEEIILRRAADFRPFLDKYYQEFLEEV